MVRQLGFITLPFSDEARQKILQEWLAVRRWTAGRSAELLPGRPVRRCLPGSLPRGGIQPGVDFVGSHGQTIWHEPVGADYLGRKVPNTLQIGGQA